MSDNKIRKVVIVGGGTAGWMTAASLSRFLKDKFCEVHVIESEDIPPVGVGEATIPQIQVFNRTLGIDENEFIRKTQGTFKLGIEFTDWGQLGESYMHAFGDLGHNMDAIFFHHYWVKMNKLGKADELRGFCLNSAAAPVGKFMRSIDAGNSPLSNINYAYQFDAGLYAIFLREYSETRGVKRTLATVDKVNLDDSNGNIKSVTLDNGEHIEGDLFIDCTGFKSLLLGEALGVDFIDWQHWLPCNRAWVVPSEKTEPLLPYTTSTAQKAGWQWRIPLQHRTGNGHVFCSKYMGEDEAKDILLKNLGSKPLTEPRLIKFDTGKRETFWKNNCIAIGLASGFMEPLESTSIHLIQSALARLMAFFPDRNFAQANIDIYNDITHFEYDSIRDFIILHYVATKRDDSDFWNYCREMEIPDTLKSKMDLFKANGHVHRHNNELFNETSWVEVLVGQGFIPESYHSLVDVLDEAEIDRRVKHIKSVVDSALTQMPTQQQFIDKFCKADPS